MAELFFLFFFVFLFGKKGIAMILGLFQVLPGEELFHRAPDSDFTEYCHGIRYLVTVVSVL